MENAGIRNDIHSKRFSHKCNINNFAFLFYAGQFFRNKPLTPKSDLRIRLITGIMGGIVGSILMFYSIRITDQINIDLRNIPLILVTIFAGFPASILMAGIISIVRLTFFDLSASAITPFLFLLP